MTTLDNRIPVSPQQQFLCMFDKGDDIGIFGPRYVHVDGVRVRGVVDTDVLCGALADLVERHVALRTTVVREQQSGSQIVNAPSSPSLRVRDLRGTAVADRDRLVQELLNEVEATELPLATQPPLRAELVQFDDDDALLILSVHHTTTDAWSMPVMLGELANRYAARKGFDVPALPTPVSYLDYTEHELASAPEYARRAREYWKAKLDGAEILAVPTDQPRSAGTWPDASWYRTSSAPSLRTDTIRTASALRSSPFMVLLAAYTVLLHNATGQTDITVPTFTPGRNNPRFQRTVGSLVNFLPLRTDISECTSFSDIVWAVRRTCLDAYRYEIPLLHLMPEAPALLAGAMAEDRALSVFQVVQAPEVMTAERVGDLEYSGVWRRELSQPVGSYVPDGMLWCLQLGPSSDILANIAYSKGLFDDTRVRGDLGQFFTLLGGLVTDPDAPLPR